jgi:hypothetical protein
MIDVLLADDDPLMRELLFEWLGEAGYGARVTHSGESALKLGAAKVLAKPFERQEPLAAAEEITSRDRYHAVRA